MSKRRINKQQRARIKKSQIAYLAQQERGEEGLVITSSGRHAEVETREGVLIHCAVRPNLDTLVAGDKVIWQAQGEHQGAIVSCYPRNTVLMRLGQSGEHKPVAANLSQVVIVIAVKPVMSWVLVDSYLVMAASLNLVPLIVLNKIDLACVALKQELMDVYQPLGYRLAFTSHGNIASLWEALENQVSVFVGQSGVGKSSLISQILPQKHIQTGKLSARTDLGCHTTSNSKFYHLPHGGALIDSPGIREFNLSHLPSGEIMAGFPEIQELVHRCKFRNCNHVNNPGCGVLKGLEEGLCSKKRYESFLRLLG